MNKQQQILKLVKRAEPLNDMIRKQRNEAFLFLMGVDKCQKK
jgi:hypothetical protein